MSKNKKAFHDVGKVAVLNAQHKQAGFSQYEST